MPCDPVKLPGGAWGLVCSRGRRSAPCLYCGRASSRLCDFKLTGEKAGKTCDKAMCDRCAYRPAGTEEDYCRAHAIAMREARPTT